MRKYEYFIFNRWKREEDGEGDEDKTTFRGSQLVLLQKKLNYEYDYDDSNNSNKDVKIAGPRKLNDKKEGDGAKWNFFYKKEENNRMNELNEIE